MGQSSQSIEDEKNDTGVGRSIDDCVWQGEVGHIKESRDRGVRPSGRACSCSGWGQDNLVDSGHLVDRSGRIASVPSKNFKENP